MAVTDIDGHRQIKDGTIQDSEISSSAAIALSKLAEAVLQADGGQIWTGAQDGGGFALINIADPTNNQDAATKAWVLANAATPTSAATVRVATTGNITLSATQTVDGVALSVGDRVLVKAQTTQANNGIYVVASGAWTRAADMDAWTEVPGKVVSVEEGTANADTLWLSTADLGGTLGTTTISFVQIPGPSDILAGAGLTRTGQTIDAISGDSSIIVNANELHVQLDAAGAITLGTGIKVNVGSGLEINANAVRVASSLAGNGLTGGSGAAIDVNVDSSTMEIVSDILISRYYRIIHNPCDVATTGNVDLTTGGLLTIDSFTVVDGSRVLVWQQTTTSQNGIYIAHSGAWTRATDADASTDFVDGALVPINGNGSFFADALFEVGISSPFTLGTSAVAFAAIANWTALEFTNGSGAPKFKKALDMNSHLINNVTDPSSAQDVATKNYVDLHAIARRIVRESPTGAINGSNTSYTLAHTPVAGSEEVFLNGILQEPGAGNDYTISSGTITYLAAPLTGDRLRVSYVW